MKLWISPWPLGQGQIWHHNWILKYRSLLVINCNAILGQISCIRQLKLATLLYLTFGQRSNLTPLLNSSLRIYHECLLSPESWSLYKGVLKWLYKVILHIRWILYILEPYLAQKSWGQGQTWHWIFQCLSQNSFTCLFDGSMQIWARTNLLGREETP